MNRSLIKQDPSSNPLSVLGNGVVITLVEDCAVLIASVEVVLLFGFALLLFASPDVCGFEETGKAEFIGLSKISVSCGVIEANLCLSRRTSSSRSKTLLQTDYNSDKTRTKV